MKNLFLFLSLFLMCASCSHNDDNMWVNIQSLQNGNIVDGHDECVITPYREEGQESPFRFPEDGYVAQVYYISNENGRLIASLDPVSKGFEESIGIWWGDYARFYMACADFGEQELQEKDFIVFRMKSQERIVTEGAETEPGYLCSVVPYFIAAQ